MPDHRELDRQKCEFRKSRWPGPKSCRHCRCYSVTNRRHLQGQIGTAKPTRVQEVGRQSTQPGVRYECMPAQESPYASALPFCSGEARSKFSTKPDQYSGRRWQRVQMLPGALPAPSRRDCAHQRQTHGSRRPCNRRSPSPPMAVEPTLPPAAPLCVSPPYPRIESACSAPSPKGCHPLSRGLRAGRWR